MTVLKKTHLLWLTLIYWLKFRTSSFWKKLKSHFIKTASVLSLVIQVQANILEYFVVCWETEGTGLLKIFVDSIWKSNFGFSCDMISCTQCMSVLNKLHYFLLVLWKWRLISVLLDKIEESLRNENHMPESNSKYFCPVCVSAHSCRETL